MRIISPVEKKKYLQELRWRMESWFFFGQPRFTGLVLGNFIYITHHAGYEWNRRITNEKSRAIGFVTDHGDGCSANVLCIRGYLDPVSLALIYLFGIIFCMFKGMNPAENVACHIIAACTALMTGAVTALQCWFTERGQESMTELVTLLRDPVRFWADAEEEIK